MATARSCATRSSWAGWLCASRAVNAAMISGARSKASNVVESRTTTETVQTAEIDSNASSSPRLVMWSTNTGMNVADRTPPSTMS